MQWGTHQKGLLKHIIAFFLFLQRIPYHSYISTTTSDSSIVIKPVLYEPDFSKKKLLKLL